MIISLINDYLEEMAKTIYDYWFVQFDFPGENGKPYKSSGGPFKNGLPIGWNYVPIKNICNILSGFPFQSDDYVQNGKYKLLTIKNVQDTGINLDVDNYISILPENMPEFCKLDIGSILMSLTGNVGRVGILYDSNCLLNQRVSLMQAKNPIIAPFIYCLLKSSKMRYILESLATGTSQKNLSPIEAGKIMIPYDSEIIKDFSIKVTPLIDSIITNLKENNNLTDLRNWLLPMLMNGQAAIED
jgi:type I restriction enzyme S subunit